MKKLPVIIGFGGINSAGRSSFHHAYRRLVLEKLKQTDKNEMYLGLASLMGLAKCTDGQWHNRKGHALSTQDLLEDSREFIEQHTLIRQLEANLFDPQAVKYHASTRLKAPAGEELRFELASKHLPHRLPEGWKVTTVDERRVLVEIDSGLDVLLPESRIIRVQSAGQLPTGFDPKRLYPSRNHPRGLQMTIFGASDAIQSVGISWSSIARQISPDEVAVYGGSGMGQLDWGGAGGMLQAELSGKRITSKQCPFSWSEMPADFINAYIIGAVGGTGAQIGACASFLYSVRAAVEDIQNGRRRIAIVGHAEAPLVPAVIEGYRVMGALADDEKLMELDGLSQASQLDYRRACRPFSSNCGFTLAESAQFIVLCDDELAMQLGAHIYGAIPEVFVNADGFKKSISGPGVGNYITIAKALACAQQILGAKALSERTFVQAHGTGTPQNRVTESHILDQAAKVFGIHQWPVSAIKCYVGHSLGPASGDQVSATLGVWKYGLVPKISTIDHIAHDVHQSHLSFLTEHLEVGDQGQDMDAAFLNAKGFGGNNATTMILSPHVVNKMLNKRYGEKAFSQYLKAKEKVEPVAAQYDQDAINGHASPIYKFNHHVMQDSDITMTQQDITLKYLDQPIKLAQNNPYEDMT